LNEWIDTTRYVYNKAIRDCEQSSIEERNSKKSIVTFQTLRNKFITENTRLTNANYPILGKELKTLKRCIEEMGKDETCKYDIIKAKQEFTANKTIYQKLKTDYKRSGS